MSYRVNRVKTLYTTIAVFSAITMIWYILKIILGHTGGMNKNVDAIISFVVSSFILLNLIIMIVIWRNMGNFKDRRLRAWSALSVFLYVVIIILNIIQGTFPLFTGFKSVPVTATGLPIALLVFTLINFLTIRKTKKTLKAL